MLDAGALDHVRALVKECSVRLVSPDLKKIGTGFFIDKDLVLTCAHVVGPKGSRVTVEPFTRLTTGGEVIDHLPGNELDLALVRIDPKPDDDPRPDDDPPPAVVLDTGLADGVSYFAVGYPTNKVLGDAGQEEIEYQGHRRLVGTDATLLNLEAGRAAVTSGLSGGPVLDSRTGAVVAIVQYSEDTKSDAGGGAIPIARASRELEFISDILRDPPSSTWRWREALGEQGWLALGKGWGWQRRVDIHVEGDRRKWNVRIRATGSDEVEGEYTARNLPDDVASALFNWAERRRIGGKEDAALVGRLLAGALVPAQVASLMVQRPGEELLVRLHVDASNDLFDVPWELMAVDSQAGAKHVAVENGLGFARIVMPPNDSSAALTPAAADATVLGIVVQPSGWAKSMPVLRFQDHEEDWPKPATLMTDLSTAVKSPPSRFLFEESADPTPHDTEQAVTRARAPGTLEVVHYIGFGKVEGGVAKLALSDGQSYVEWRPISDLFTWAQQGGARLLVVEFVLPRAGSELEPLPPSAFAKALGGRLNAVVFTRFPVHPRQFNAFNLQLYQSLGAGVSVETAVQQARQVVYRNALWGDAGAFGSFTLITGPAHDMRLLPASPTTIVSQQPAPDPGRSATAPGPALPPDQFQRSG